MLYYAHGKITKRELLDQAKRFAVGDVTAAELSWARTLDWFNTYLT